MPLFVSSLLKSHGQKEGPEYSSALAVAVSRNSSMHVHVSPPGIADGLQDHAVEVFVVI